MMVVVTGASGSGKSEYAEGVAVKLAGKGDLYYLATMRVYGEEGVRRVERHRKCHWEAVPIMRRIRSGILKFRIFLFFQWGPERMEIL